VSRTAQVKEQVSKRIHGTEGRTFAYQLDSQSSAWLTKSMRMQPLERKSLADAPWVLRLSPEDTLPINIVLDAIVEYQIIRSLERRIPPIADLTNRMAHIERALKRGAGEIRSLHARVEAVCEAIGVEQRRERDLEVANLAREIANSFGKLLDPLRQAEAVLVTPESGGFTVTTVVDDIDEQTANRIYALELKLAMLYADVSFDFRIFRRQGRDLQSLLTVRSSDVLVPIQV